MLSHRWLICLFYPLSHPQYIDAIGNKQGELESYVSDGYKTALTEERRRFCFLVEKQCAVAKNSAAYHSKVGAHLRGAEPSPCWRNDCFPREHRDASSLELS